MTEGTEHPTTTPPPTFDDLALSPELRQAIDDLGYTHPTPVQREVFEPARRGVDLVVQARTGTGKTAAFGMPIIDSLVRRGQNAVQAVILCPTRELALQVTRELEALGKYRGVKPVAVYGGAPMPRQVDQIRAGAQVLVGTPGRVLDHLQRGTLDVSQVRLFVLDESDEMLSMGFLPQIDQIQAYLPATRQTLLFSATLPPDIQRLAETRLRNPEFLTLSGDHIGALEITHLVYLSRTDKLGEFVQLLEVEDPESAIVFCNTRDETKRVAYALQQQGYAADWLNADLAQADREKVMAATRQGELRFLVCTDVAARGIDISHLTHVINFDFPEAAENYVHRTGRTGRAGRTGTAISLVAPSDIGNLYLTRLTYKIRTIERQLPSLREIKTRAETDLIEMFVQAFGTRAVHADDLALARRLLTHEESERVVAGLIRDHLGARPDAQEEAGAARHSKRPREADPVAVQDTATRRRRRGAAAEDPGEAGVRRPQGHPMEGPSRPRPPESERAFERSSTDSLPTDEDAARQSDTSAGDEASEPSAKPVILSKAVQRPADLNRPRRARSEPGRSRRELGRAGHPRQGAGERFDGDFEFAYTVSEMTPEKLASADKERARTAEVTRHDASSEVEATEDEGAARDTGASESSSCVNRAAAGLGEGRPVEGRPVEGRPVEGRPVEGRPRPAEGRPVEGRPRPVEGRPRPVEGRPVEGRPVEGRPVEGRPVEGETEGSIASEGDPEAGLTRLAELYVNVGRQDGATAADFETVLVERGAMTRAEIGYIRVRNRHTFVAVPEGQSQRALDALDGAEIAGKSAVAEPARPRT